MYVYVLRTSAIYVNVLEDSNPSMSSRAASPYVVLEDSIFESSFYSTNLYGVVVAAQHKFVAVPFSP